MYMGLNTVNRSKGKPLICHMRSPDQFTGTMCAKLINVPDKADSGSQGLWCSVQA